MEEGSSSSVYPITSGHSVTSKEQLCSPSLPSQREAGWQANSSRRCVLKCISPLQETKLFPSEVLMGIGTTAPDALGACQLLQGPGVHTVPMHTIIFGFSKCPTRILFLQSQQQPCCTSFHVLSY